MIKKQSVYINEYRLQYLKKYTNLPWKPYKMPFAFKIVKTGNIYPVFLMFFYPLFFYFF